MHVCLLLPHRHFSLPEESTSLLQGPGLATCWAENRAASTQGGLFLGSSLQTLSRAFLCWITHSTLSKPSFSNTATFSPPSPSTPSPSHLLPVSLQSRNASFCKWEGEALRATGSNNVPSSYYFLVVFISPNQYNSCRFSLPFFFLWLFFRVSIPLVNCFFFLVFFLPITPSSWARLSPLRIGFFPVDIWDILTYFEFPTAKSSPLLLLHMYNSMLWGWSGQMWPVHVPWAFPSFPFASLGKEVPRWSNAELPRCKQLIFNSRAWSSKEELF